MATASVTNSFSAATTISSSQVNTNFSDLVSFLNASVLHLDGSKTMSGDLSLGSNDVVSAGDVGAATGTFSGAVSAGAFLNGVLNAAQTTAVGAFYGTTVDPDAQEMKWAAGSTEITTDAGAASTFVYGGSATLTKVLAAFAQNADASAGYSSILTVTYADENGMGVRLWDTTTDAWAVGGVDVAINWFVIGY